MGRNWQLRRGVNSDYYVDENGEESRTFRTALEYHDGFGLVMLYNDKYAYRDLEGKLSQEYFSAKSYSDGYGLVKLANGKYAYRSRDGKLSKKYPWAESYSSGYGLVKLSNGKFAYRDLNGNLSESYLWAKSYVDGFSIVKLDNCDLAYRDIDGNILSQSEYKKTKEFFNGSQNIYDLKDDAFESDALVDVMLKKLKTNAKKSIELATTKKELDAVEDDYTKDTEYVLSKAYDAKQKQDEFSASKQSLLDKLNLR